MRADHGTDDVMGIAHICHPIANGFVSGILERLRPAEPRLYTRSKHVHPEHIQALSMNILFAHVDHALESHESRHRSRSYPVLPCPSLSDDAPFAHPLCEQDLAESVVDLMGTGVEKIL